MEKVLIAGATGYLGHFVAKAFKDKNYYTKVLVRHPEKFKQKADLIVQAEVTKPETLHGICDDIDIVFTTVGITKQKEGLTYHDVDFQANLNLLNEAIKSRVKKFVYVSVLNGEKFRNLKICEEKERFVEELKKSGLDYVIIRPNGYFSDMGEYLQMAQKGRVYLFGNGNNQINPISGKDLAECCVSATDGTEKEVAVGGSQTFTHNEIAKLAFEVAGKPEKITHIPLWLVNGMLNLSRLLLSSKTYGPFEFVATILSHNMIAPPYGNDKLRDYFEELQKSKNVN